MLDLLCGQLYMYCTINSKAFAITIFYCYRQGMYYKPEGPAFYNLNCNIEFPLLND